MKCILYCRCRWKWRVIIAVNFQFKQLEGRSLKSIRASTWFDPMTSAITVQCSTNWAVKPHIGSEVNLLSSCLPMQWNDVKYIRNAYCTAVVEVCLPIEALIFFRLLPSNCLNLLITIQILLHDHNSLSAKSNCFGTSTLECTSLLTLSQRVHSSDDWLHILK